MISQGKIDLAKIAAVCTEWLTVSYAAFYWAFGVVLATGYRWYLLLQAMGIGLSLRQALSLTTAGTFYSAIIPGTVSGDLVKGYYVTKAVPGISKAAVIFSMFLDRVVGLLGLLTLSLIGIVTFALAEPDHPAFSHPVALLLAGGTLALFCGILAAFGLLALLPKLGFVNTVLARYPNPFFSRLEKLSAAVRNYDAKAKALAQAWFLSVLNQLVLLGLYWLVSMQTLGTAVSPFKILAVVPLGITATIVPLAPGGLGVGHAAFEFLFTLVGLAEGANIFSVVYVGSQLFNLLGGIPSLLGGNLAIPSKDFALEAQDAAQKPL